MITNHTPKQTTATTATRATQAVAAADDHQTRPDGDENAPDQLVRAGLYVVIVGAIVVSGDTLIYLASQAGWGGWRAWLLPVLIDLPGFLGGRIWLRRKPTNPQTRAYARRLTLAALGTSLSGNVTGHLLHAGQLPAGLALVIVAAMIAPIVLAAVLHLDALLTPTRHRSEPAPESETATTSTATPAAIEPKPEQPPANRATSKQSPGRPSRPGPSGRSGSAKARGRELWDAARSEGRSPSGAELANAVGVDPSLGRRWRREWESDTETETDRQDTDRQDATDQRDETEVEKEAA